MAVAVDDDEAMWAVEVAVAVDEDGVMWSWRWRCGRKWRWKTRCWVDDSSEELVELMVMVMGESASGGVGPVVIFFCCSSLR